MASHEPQTLTDVMGWSVPTLSRLRKVMWGSDPKLDKCTYCLELLSSIEWGDAHITAGMLDIHVKPGQLSLPWDWHGSTCHACEAQGLHEVLVHPLGPSWHAQMVTSHISLSKNDSRVTPTNLKAIADRTKAIPKIQAWLEHICGALQSMEGHYKHSS